MSALLEPPVRSEYERRPRLMERGMPEQGIRPSQRIWEHGWLRKGLLLAVLATLWEALGRWQSNDLLLPTFLQAGRALVEGLASGGWGMQR
jgi:NitT/TauT family transport system permease protein